MCSNIDINSYPPKIQSFIDLDHTERLKSQLKRFCDSIKFSDLRIESSERTFYVHKNVINAFNDYQPGYKEFEKIEQIDLKDINKDGVEAVVDYCYTGKLEFEKKDAIEVFKAAGSLKIRYVVRCCSEYLENIIDFQNCLDIFKLAKKFSCVNLMLCTSEFIRTNFNQIIFTQDKLTQDMFPDLLSLNLNVFDEDDVWYAVKDILEYPNPEDNYRVLYSLLELIKLPFLSSKVLQNEVLLKCGNDVHCKNLVNEAIKWQTNQDYRLKSFRTTQREPLTTVLAVGSWSENSSSSIEAYDPLEKRWFELADLKFERRNYSVVLLDDCLWLIGGFDKTGMKNTVETFNLKTGDMKTMPSMNSIRSHPAVAVVGNCIYAIGGRDNNGSLATAERWDPESNSWINIEPMPTARTGTGVTVFNNKIYVIGGYETSKGCASAANEAYCPVTGKWEVYSPMLVKRMWLGVASDGKFIYAIGGREVDSHITQKYASVEKFDPVNNMNWRSIAEISEPRYGIGGGTLYGRLLAVAGADGKKQLKDVEMYDTKSHTWTKIAPLNSAREIPNIVTVPWDLVKSLK